MVRSTTYAKNRHNYNHGGISRHQATNKAYTMFVLAVLTCCPGMAALTFDHTKISKQISIMDMENANFVIPSGQYEHMQDEQIFLDSHERHDHGTKSRRHRREDSTFSYFRRPEIHDGLAYMNSTCYTSRNTKKNWRIARRIKEE